MTKRKTDETKEERRERKRIKKEKKSLKKEERRKPKQEKQELLTGNEVFVNKRLELIVSILPSGLGDVKSSIEDSLRLLLLQYSDGVGGILLGFDNLEILRKDSGLILNELPHIHYKVLIDALVFAPFVGCRLQGLVTESFHSHISLLVFKFFNASVSSEQMEASGFQFDDVELMWYKNEIRVKNKDIPLEFECQHIYESGGLISIEGTKPALPMQVKSF